MLQLYVTKIDNSPCYRPNILKVLVDMKRSGAVLLASMLWLSHLVCDFINFCCAVHQKQPRSRLQIMAKKRGTVRNVCISWAILIAWCHFVRRKSFYGVDGNNKTYVGCSTKCPKFLPDCNQMWNFSRGFHNSFHFKFHGNRLSGSCGDDTYGRAG